MAKWSSKVYVGIIRYILGLYRDNGKTVIVGIIRMIWGLCRDCGAYIGVI